MKFKVYLYTSVRVIIFCSLGFFISWVLEDCHAFFGDTYHPVEYRTNSEGKQEIWNEAYWQWSGRHIWATVCTSTLILISLADMVIGTIRVVKQNYDTSKW